MKRRSFLQGIIALVGFAAAPGVIANDKTVVGRLFGATAAPDEMVEEQYAAMYIADGCDDVEMPADLRSMLDERVEFIAERVHGRIVSRKYIWLSAGRCDMSDPLGQRGYAGCKVGVLVPKRDHDARVAAEIRDGGWKPADSLYRYGYDDVELADFLVDGKLRRYGRSMGNGRG